MALKYHDGPVPYGFSGYHRLDEDPNGESPSGNYLDTHYDETPRQRPEITPAQQQILDAVDAEVLSPEDAALALQVLDDMAKH